jgi:chromosome segregation ATPase
MSRQSVTEIEEIPAAKRTLAETLQLGVHNLWKAVISHEGKISKHDKTFQHVMAELERLNAEVVKLRSEIRGLKVSAGKAKAAKRKMEQELVAASTKLSEAKKILLH